MKRTIIFLSAMLLLSVTHTSCIEDGGDTLPFSQDYYKPIYANPNDLLKVNVKEARPLQDPGRIYLKGTLLIINERFQGFHLIDNSNPAEPKPLMFLEVQGAVNMAMQDHYLYADNVTDLITIDLSNLQQIKEVNRKKNVFKAQQNYPPFTNVSFECVDSKRGVVIGWEKADLPKGARECWR